MKTFGEIYQETWVQNGGMGDINYLATIAYGKYIALHIYNFHVNGMQGVNTPADYHNWIQNLMKEMK